MEEPRAYDDTSHGKRQPTHPSTPRWRVPVEWRGIARGGATWLSVGKQPRCARQVVRFCCKRRRKTGGGCIFPARQGRGKVKREIERELCCDSIGLVGTNENETAGLGGAPGGGGGGGGRPILSRFSVPGGWAVLLLPSSLFTLRLPFPPRVFSQVQLTLSKLSVSVSLLFLCLLTIRTRVTLSIDLGQ